MADTAKNGWVRKPPVLESSNSITRALEWTKDEQGVIKSGVHELIIT